MDPLYSKMKGARQTLRGCSGVNVMTSTENIKFSRKMLFHQNMNVLMHKLMLHFLVCRRQTGTELFGSNEVGLVCEDALKQSSKLTWNGGQAEIVSSTAERIFEDQIHHDSSWAVSSCHTLVCSWIDTGFCFVFLCIVFVHNGDPKGCSGLQSCFFQRRIRFGPCSWCSCVACCVVNY